LDSGNERLDLRQCDRCRRLDESSWYLLNAKDGLCKLDAQTLLDVAKDGGDECDLAGGGKVVRGVPLELGVSSFRICLSDITVLNEVIDGYEFAIVRRSDELSVELCVQLGAVSEKCVLSGERGVVLDHVMLVESIEVDGGRTSQTLESTTGKKGGKISTEVICGCKRGNEICLGDVLSTAVEVSVVGQSVQSWARRANV